MGILSEKDFLECVKKLSAKSFKVGEREIPEVVDTNDTRYVESGEFCANLHIHTQYSDGIMSIPELLTEAKKYKNILVAITDHDTVEGCKEAHKINDKDVNLCLGIEVSTIAINFPKQQNPLPIHLLVYGINPFDKKLNEYLDYKRDLKLKLAKETVENLNNELPEYDFSLEEASLCHPMILKGQDEVAHPLKKYTCGKILLNHYFPNADFSYEEPIFKFKYLFKGLEPYFITYKRALEMYAHCALPLIPDEVIEKIYRAKCIYSKAHPAIGKMLEPFWSFEEAVSFFAGFGVLSIAHPARVRAYTPEFYNYLFYNFKKYGKEKAMFYEKYYQSYEGRYFSEWETVIDRAAEGLIPTGGTDSHGSNILYRSSHY